MNKQTEKTLAVILHLSGLFSGMMPIIIPLCIWLLKKEESILIDKHGKEALNFQLSVLVLGLLVTAFFTFTLAWSRYFYYFSRNFNIYSSILILHYKSNYCR